MPNFLLDNTSLPNNKVDLNDLPGGASIINYVRALEWNNAIQALFDIRSVYNDFGVVDIKKYGVTANGGTDDYAAFEAAIAANPSYTVLLIPGPCRIATNLQIPAHITLLFSSTGQLKPDAGVTVTVLGGIRCGETQIFAGSGTVNTSSAIGIVSRGVEATPLTFTGKLIAGSALADVVVRSSVTRTNGKLLSIVNNNSEVAYIDYQGNYFPLPEVELDPLTTSTILAPVSTIKLGSIGDDTLIIDPSTSSIRPIWIQTQEGSTDPLGIVADVASDPSSVAIIFGNRTELAAGKIVGFYKDDAVTEVASVNFEGVGTFAGINLNPTGTASVEYDGSTWLNFAVPTGDGFKFLVNSVEVGSISSTGSASFAGLLSTGDLSVSTGIIKTETSNTPLVLRSNVTDADPVTTHRLVSTNTITEDDTRYLLDVYRTNGTGTPTYRLSSAGMIRIESGAAAGFTVVRGSGRTGSFRTAGGSGELFQLGGDGGGSSVTEIQLGPTALSAPEVSITSSLLTLKSGVTITGASSTSLQLRGGVSSSPAASAVKIGNANSFGANNDRWILEVYGDNMSTSVAAIDGAGGYHRTGSNQSLMLWGNKTAGDTGYDVVVNSKATRSAGYLLGLQNNGNVVGGLTWEGDLHKLKSNNTLVLRGNRNAADAGADVDIQATATRSNGFVLKVTENLGATDLFTVAHEGSGRFVGNLRVEADINANAYIAINGGSTAELRSRANDGAAATGSIISCANTLTSATDRYIVKFLRSQSSNDMARITSSGRGEFDGGVVIGASGAPIVKTLTATATWDPASINAGTATSTTITVTGAAVGDHVLASLTTLTVTSHMMISAYVQATDTVRVTIYNGTGGTQNLDEGTLRATVIKMT